MSAATTVEEIWAAIRALPPEGRLEIRRRFDAPAEPLPPPRDADEFRARVDELNRRLVAKGSMSRLPDPIPPDRHSMPRNLVHVPGRPVSETLIEDRR